MGNIRCFVGVLKNMLSFRKYSLEKVYHICQLVVKDLVEF